MARIFHILKDGNPTEALAAISIEAQASAQNMSVLMIQEAVRLNPDLPVKIYVLKEDAQKRGITSEFESIQYEKMLDLILTSHSVVVW
jgi:sulfur transfer complex TusBCD TusB component (DsrH family)